jgi:prevent-host-death family protein
MSEKAEVGIRALKQNASAVVARVAQGEHVTVTDRGRPVAQMTALPERPLDRLVASGRARMPRRDIRDLPAPPSGSSLSTALAEMRNEERY